MSFQAKVISYNVSTHAEGIRGNLELEIPASELANAEFLFGKIGELVKIDLGEGKREIIE